MPNSSFILFNDLRDPVLSLSDEEAGKLFKAIFEYQNGGNHQELKGSTSMAFSFIKQQLDRSAEHYEMICERNRVNGAKGGRPVSKTSNKSKPKKPTGLSGNPDNPTEPSLTLPKPYPDPKPKSNPKRIYGEAKNIEMTEEEYKKCIDTYGRQNTTKAIEKLSSFKLSNGKKYKSDYGALNTWVWDSIEADKVIKPEEKKRYVPETITKEEQEETARLIEESGGLSGMMNDLTKAKSFKEK